MKKILLLWYMENDNFGDTLISDTTNSILKKNGYEIKNYEVGEKPENIISIANECNFLLFAGGGIIERYIPPILKKFDIYVEKILVPYGVMGISVGNFNYDNKSISLGKWVDKANFFYTRDQRSSDILNKYSIKKKSKCSGDCVLLNERLNNEISNFRTKVGVNLRDLPYKDLTGDFDWKKIMEIIHQINTNKIIMDSSDVTKQIFISPDDYNRYNDYLLKNKIDKANQIIEEISGCRIIVAMRYHIILCAAMLGIPTISVKYCPKVETLVEQLGIQDIAVDILEYEEIVSKYGYLINNYDRYKKVIMRNVNILKIRVDLMYRDVLRKIETATNG